MKQEDACIDRKVIWVRKSPCPPIQCKITEVYTVDVRVGFYQRSYDPLKNNHWKEEDVSVRRLVPDRGQRLNGEELKKELNPAYKKKSVRRRYHSDDDFEGETWT